MYAGTPLTKDDSYWIDIARITMIFGLVIHHVFEVPGSNFYPRDSLTLATTNLPNLLNSYIHWLTMSAVPVLSIMSGYLYFRGRSDHSKQLLKRLKTVVVPWVAWTFIWIAFLFVIYKLGLGNYNRSNLEFDNLGLIDLVKSTFGIKTSTFVMQFWFLHDLALTLCLAPVIGFFLKRFPQIFVSAVGVVWFLDLVPFPFVKGDVLMFFVIGSCISLYCQSITGLIDRVMPCRAYIWLLFMVTILGRSYKTMMPFLDTIQYLCLLRIVGTLSVCLFLRWLMLRYRGKSEHLQNMVGFSFFIFACHWPIIDLVKAAIQQLPENVLINPLVQTAALITIPLLTATICCCLLVVLRRASLPVAKLLNGSR